MNGRDAAVCALLDSGVKIVTGVPGYPITELMEALGGKIRYEWSVNEKVALEVALGSSVCGERSAVITKHVGMNILADPLVTSSTHTIGAGIVIFAGDDPGVEKSQNEQDSRYYGLIAEVPVFDPSTPQALYMSVGEAFKLSEKVSTPAIVRLTDRLLRSEGHVKRKNRPDHMPPPIDKKIWHLTMLGKHQRFHGTVFPEMCRSAEKSQLNAYKKMGMYGIISSGFPSSLVESVIHGSFSHLSLCTVNPLPQNMIDRFLNDHERVLVVEETEPVIERQLPEKVLGKLTGHMPYGTVEAADIKKAIENIERETAAQQVMPQTIRERGERPICEDCPYLPLYRAVKELNVPVAGDMGCSIRASAPPLSLLDAAFSLGSAIGTACGFSRKGIAIIGDFGLAHSGVAGLINAVHNKHEVVVIVLQNEIAAMTGGQQVPDLTRLVSSYIKDTVMIDPQADIDIKSLLEEKLGKRGVSVVLAQARCPRY
ncbi:MAG: thiamine pyrophosphate-dependent enzyme [Candidatus Methanoperedens sp.]|nr:thiamine pyrophosphate-dependent enzyme [Candidatus Methanoperedens sp.]